MIDLHYWTTPNGNKILLYLLEAGLEYKLVEVNIGRGAQFAPAFLAIAPNNRIPAIVDHAPTDGGPPIPVFESGAILLYLAGKVGKFVPTGLRAVTEVHEWLMWQMGGLGPMFGQAHHFRAYAATDVEYAIARYTNEATRLYNVLNNRLAGREFVAGDYSIADMAIYPWTLSYERQGQDIDDFPAVRDWQARMAARPAVGAAYTLINEMRERNIALVDDEEAKKHLFGQTDTKSPAAG